MQDIDQSEIEIRPKLKPLKLKKSKKNPKPQTPIPPSPKGNPCQSKPIDFRGIFADDHQNNAGLTRNYLEKLNEVEKKNAKTTEKYIKLKYQNKLLEKQLDLQIDALTKAERDHSMLSHQNVKLNEELLKLRKVYEATIHNKRLREDKEELLKARNGDRKMTDVNKANRYTSENDQRVGNAMKMGIVHKYEGVKSSDYYSSNEDANARRKLDRTAPFSYFHNDKGDIGSNLCVYKNQSQRIKLCASNYKF